MEIPLSPRLVRVNGPLLEIEGLADVAMSELVALGVQGIPGEVVAIRGTTVTVQAYEYTGGMAAGDPVAALGHPLSARLGPHLLGGVFDGLLRPLSGAPTWLVPEGDRRDQPSTWTWQPQVTEGETVSEGAVLGTVPVSNGLEFRVLVPPGTSGRVEWLAPDGTHGIQDEVAAVSGVPVSLATDWPVRRARPVRARLKRDEPLLTGQRVLDAVFPLALGSTAAVPGGFGTGKTMLLQQIAKWCAAEVIVYVGCGERGNEMADVLAELSELADPRTGRRLAERTVIIANTSNMPMMAREASIYTGVTVAEFFRDMGYDAVVIADSTSRWAEALREFASRSGALPAEEGYPASLPSALAAFYERGGRVTTLGGRRASVTIIGAVSPPGGDTTEPVTAHTQRFVRGVWALDRDLAYARHYPAVAWAGSFSRDADALGSGTRATATRSGPDAGPGPPACWPRPTASATSPPSSARGHFPAMNAWSSSRGACCAKVCCSRTPSRPTTPTAPPQRQPRFSTRSSPRSTQCDEAIGRGVIASEIEELDFSLLLRAAAGDAPRWS